MGNEMFAVWMNAWQQAWRPWLSLWSPWMLPGANTPLMPRENPFGALPALLSPWQGMDAWMPRVEARIEPFESAQVLGGAQMDMARVSMQVFMPWLDAAEGVWIEAVVGRGEKARNLLAAGGNPKLLPSQD